MSLGSALAALAALDATPLGKWRSSSAATHPGAYLLAAGAKSDSCRAGLGVDPTLPGRLSMHAGLEALPKAVWQAATALQHAWGALTERQTGS